MDDKALIRDILKRGELLSLGVMDEGGVWVCDVISVADDAMNLYWISKKDTRHSLAVKVNHRVAATISLHNEPAGIQIQGSAELIEPLPQIIKEIVTKQRREASTTLEEGYGLYRLHPERIELIHIPLYGFQKKKISF